MPGPPSPDPSAWRWRGEWCGAGREECLRSHQALQLDLDGRSWVRRGAGGLEDPTKPVLPARHLPPAVSGVPTALRAPASDAMGPAPQRMTVGSTREKSSGQGTARRPRAGPQTVSSAPGRASACGHGSSRGQVSAKALSLRGAFRGLDSWVKGRRGWGPGLDWVLIPVPTTPGETRRILSVQPTYDWTCFSHSLLNVSPMPVESSPPLPCPTPCHLLPNCTSCLDSKGADGGWQHCVWSSSLQQVLHLARCPGAPLLCPGTTLSLLPPPLSYFLPYFPKFGPSLTLSFLPLSLFFS